LTVLPFGCQAFPGAGPAPQDDLPVLKTDGTQYVIVRHKGLDAEWLLRLPETVGTNDATYMVWEPISVEWKEYGNGEIGYEWKPSREWLQRAQRYTKIVRLPVRSGIGVAVRMRPSPKRIDMLIALTNLTDKPLRDVTSEGGCFAAHRQRFFDLDRGQETAFKTITGGIFEFGFSDAILQMWASYVYELAKGQPLKSFAGCVTPEETALSHRLFAAALASQRQSRVVSLA